MKSMSSHFANEKYYLLNKNLTETYFKDICKLRYYQNTAMAAYDVALSLQIFLAHKTHFAVAKNGSSVIESLSPLWLRQLNPLQIKNDSQSWIEFIETLNPETNFVIWASENEITGEILVSETLALEIHQLLSHKRIYSIQICHQINPAEKFFPFAIKILRPHIFEDKSAFVIHSDRFKAISQVGNFQKINTDELKLDSFIQENKIQNLAEIQKFESEIENLKNLYFSRFVSTTPRISDRLVLSLSDVNAYAIQQELELSEKICFAPSKYPFWILNLWKTWWKEAENEKLIRGLLVISIHALRQDENLLKKINLKVAEFQRLGSVNTL